jgi:hypothetical protein
MISLTTVESRPSTLVREEHESESEAKALAQDLRRNMQGEVRFDLVSAEGIRKFRSFMVEAAHLVVRYGGSISSEHGDGQARAELLPIMFGDEMVQALVEFKRIWEPFNRMNPHNVVEPYALAQNLRLGADYYPRPVTTYFKYTGDHYTFHRAALRCAGVGECRKTDSGTMCPSYLVTREEADSTRGRAHLLFGMMQGERITEGWKSEAVKGALELCLAFKGCKGECPVNLDTATYKAEFLAHYYRGRLRPRHAYSIGSFPSGPASPRTPRGWRISPAMLRS